MKAFEFTMTVLIESASEAEAKAEAEVVLVNLEEMCGYSPFTVSLDLDIDSCVEVDLEEEDLS